LSLKEDKKAAILTGRILGKDNVIKTNVWTTKNGELIVFRDEERIFTRL